MVKIERIVYHLSDMILTFWIIAKFSSWYLFDIDFVLYVYFLCLVENYAYIFCDYSGCRVMYLMQFWNWYAVDTRFTSISTAVQQWDLPNSNICLVAVRARPINCSRYVHDRYPIPYAISPYCLFRKIRSYFYFNRNEARGIFWIRTTHLSVGPTVVHAVLLGFFPNFTQMFGNVPCAMPFDFDPYVQFTIHAIVWWNNINNRSNKIFVIGWPIDIPFLSPFSLNFQTSVY